MPDRRPTLDAKRRKHVRILKRRRDYLAKAIEEPNSESSRAWDQGELAAIDFALRTINNYYQPEAAAQ
jgi:hypothetical protein